MDDISRQMPGMTKEQLQAIANNTDAALQRKTIPICNEKGQVIGQLESVQYKDGKIVGDIQMRRDRDA